MRVALGKYLLVAAVILGCLVRTNACDTERDLKLKQLKSMQVIAELIAPAEVDLSLESIQGKFVAAVRSAGIGIDTNNYNNTLTIRVIIERLSLPDCRTIYAVEMHCEYGEMCPVPRLNIKAYCKLWQEGELIKYYAGLPEAREFILASLSTWASEFDTVLKTGKVSE